MNNEQKPKREKDKLLGILCISALIFLVLFTIVNYLTISYWLSTILSVLNPVVIGFIIAYLCNPIYNWLRAKPLKGIKRAKLKKTLSIVITYLVVLAIVALLLVIIIPQVVVAFNDLIGKFDGYINTAISWANNFISNSEFLSSEYADIFDFFDVKEFTSDLTNIIKNSGNLLKNISNVIIDYGSNIVIGVKDLFMGFLISIYVLIFKESIAKWFKRILRIIMSRNKYDSFIRRVDHANSKFGNYIIGAITDSIIVAVECFIIFTIFGIPYAPLIAVIVGITNIIPILGPFLGAVPSAFIIFIVDPGKVILFIILILVIQQIDGNIVAPFILGSSLGLSSFGILLAITIMGGLWGIPGMFIGVPLFAFFADMIEESVNTRLSLINDPDFPPSEEKNDDVRTSPILTFVKKYAFKAGVSIKKAALAQKNKNNKNKK